jgi:PAS domain S-box-containing protein
MKDQDNMATSLDPAALSPYARALRKRALERLRILEDSELESLGPQEIKHLIHELRVHQIELEIQNEELRLAQEELKASRSRYSDLYDFAPGGYLLLNNTGLILNANLTAATLLGAPRGTLIKVPITRFILRDDQDTYYQHRNRLVETDIPQTIELRMVKKDETVFWARLQASLSHDSSGTPVSRIVLSDITEQKQLESASRESENRFRKLFEQHSAVKLILDAETGKIVDANEAAVQFYGWSLEDLQRMSIHEINTLPPEAVQAAMRKAASFKSTRFEFRHRRADGSIRDVEVFSNRIENAGRNFFYSIIHDISERKQTEKELQKNREELQIILDSSPILIFFKDCENRFIRVNKALAEVTGLPKEAIEGKTVLEIYPNQVKDYWEDDKEVIASGKPKIGIIEPIEGATGRRWLQTDKIPCRDKDGCIVGIIGFSIDITERLQVEVAQKESEERFRTLANAIPQLCWIANAEGWLFWYNQRWYEYTGTTPEQMEGWGWQSVHDPVELPKVMERWQASIVTGEAFEMTFPLLGADGVFRPFLTRIIPLKDATGKVKQWFGTNTDVSELKRIEQALRESEALYRGIGESIDYGVWVCAPDGRNIYASESFLKMVGITQEQCSNFGWGDVLHPDDAEGTIAAWQECVRTGGKWDIEHRFRGMDGQWHHVLARGVPVRNEQGEIIRWAGINLDINQLKQAEQELRESEERLRMVLRATSIGTFEINFHNGEGQWNDVEFELLGLKPGYAPGNPETFFQYVHPSDIEMLKAKWENALLFGELDAEFRILRADNGQERWLAGKGRFLYDNGDKSQAMKFLGVNFDITDRKQAEDQIKASLAEKLVMLKEIHHRVKNNLQVISSLVSLQASNLNDEWMRKELGDVQDRIRSMALIHEKLYQTSNLARMNFAEYATSLLQSIWSSHGTLAAKARLNLALSPVEFSIEAAVPCGLILNELAGNALKHAFPNDSDGEVTVGLEHDPTLGTVCLQVRDNGVGLPEGLDWQQSKSLGLRLVRILAGQLHGTVEMETGTGTEFRVTFSLKGFQA